MYISKNRIIGVSMALFGLGLLVGSASTLAVDCDETLTGGGSVTIFDHIGPCDGDPALTIEGPINVDFNGFTLECGQAPKGILIVGQNAKVQNGIVANCKTGIQVEGKGDHQILKMTVNQGNLDERDYGFLVESANNHLVQNIVDGVQVRSDQGEGFQIKGHGNRLVNNRALNNNQHGFRLRGDGEHQLINNLAEGNGQEGYRLESDGNRLVNNVAIYNRDEGFRAKKGTGNVLINNRAEENGMSDGEAGFRIQSNENVLHNNNAVFNRGGDGISGDGILLNEGAENNDIAHNAAYNNGGTDLVDQNPDCDNNVWFKNRYGARNQDCVD